MPFKDDQKASGSCAQHMENMDENRKKVLCFAQKYQNQVEVSGVISWMTGSMANPCISQWNCSADKELRSLEERGHVK